MRRFRLWVHADSHQRSLAPLVDAALEGDFSLVVSDELIDVALDPYVRPEKPEALRDLWIADAGTNVRVATLDERVFDWVEKAQLYRMLTTLPYGAYSHETFLMRVMQDAVVYETLKAGIATQLNTSLMTTLHVFAEANMNVSIAAKRLHLHRNTVMYRLEQVEQLTTINPRVFDGLAVFRTLFSR